MFSRKLIPCVVASSFMLPAIPSWSQLEEVIVTARKREESVLNVPVAVTAFSGAQLEQFGTNDMYTLTERVPGFVMGTQVASIGPTPSLRGIGTGTLNPTIDQSVSLNVDGLGFSQALAFSSALFDMSGMEVLRGPQSLFYGKNSTAGVISVTTMDPGDELDLEFTAGYEQEAEEQLYEAIVSGPITDTFGARLAARFTDEEGYFENVGEGDGVSSFDPKYPQTPQKEELVLRGTLLWEPTSDFTAKLKGNYIKTDINGNGGAGQMVSCPDGLQTDIPDDFIFPLAPFFGTQNPQFMLASDGCKLDDKLAVVDVNPNNPLYEGVRNNGVPFYDMEQYFGSLLLDWELSENLTLSSVTGYYNMDHDVLINGGQTGNAGPLILADTSFEREDLTQEFRLTSNYSGAWNYMVGAYYQDAEMANTTGLFFFQPVFGSFPKGYLPIDATTMAVFGQVLWQITPDIEIAAGARWTDEEREFDPYNLTADEPFPIESYVTDKLATDDISPDISVTWTPTDTMTMFVGYRKAFKSGSWDTVSNPNGLDKSFDDEQVEGFEGGIKTLLAQNTVSMNVSAYHYEYTDLQVGANQSTPQGFEILTKNAASATVQGIDLDVAWAPASVPGLELFGVVNYNDASYDEFSDAECWGGQTALDGCNRTLDEATGLYTAQDLSGGDLLRAPEWGATFGVTYERDIGNNMILSLGSSTLWSDEYAMNTLLRDDMYQDSYYKTSANIGVRAENGAWEVNLIGKNLNDEVTAGNCTNFNGVYGNLPTTLTTGSPDGSRGIAGVDELTCIAERGRQLWLKVTIRPSAWM